MNLYDALILGFVEGITEFLPISSTGHLILAGDFLGLPSTELLKSFDIVIQSGAISAAALLYGRSLITQKRILMLTVASFIPTGIAGFLLHGYIKTHLFGTSTVVTSLFIGGAALILFEWWMKQRKTQQRITIDTMAVPHAILIGFAQALALIPGTSRSAMTIMAGMLLGIERKAIVEFSFLLAIPTMAAATGYDLMKSTHLFSLNDVGVLIIGFLCSFITAIIAIRWLMRFIGTHTFIGFGVYRIVVAIILWKMLL